MKRFTPTRLLLSAAVGSALLSSPLFAQTGSLNEAITGGKLSGQMRLRYESVDQDNAAQDADALTLRSTVNFATAAYKGFSAVVEMEDVRSVFGVDDYTVGPSGYNPGLYSVVADPDTTELNQGFIQYVNGGFSAKLGRQVIAHDSQRFVGAVGWRQDWQTFDAFTAQYTVNDDLKLSYNFIDQRERIFAEDADVDSSDHLFHADYKTGLGTLTGYAYLLEVDDTPVSNSLDTYGLRFKGASKLGDLPVTYLAEYASQESDSGAVSYDADYLMLEGGMTVSGITAKLGYELLGSDNGAYGFATPLATLHAFNGWADLFLGTPGTGLEDTYFNVSGKLLGGTLMAVYHDYDADDSTPTISDLGSEINLQFVRPIASRYTLGLKYADYDSGDMAAKPDTEKVWVWLQAKF